MRVVIDTNVLLSALISKHGPPYAIYRAWRGRRFDLITSRTQLEELRRASRYAKFGGALKPHVVGAIVNNLKAAIVLDRLRSDIEIDDPFDAFLLAMVEASDADWLVTGDKRAGLLEHKRHGRARIVTPAGFVSALRISEMSS